MSSVLDKVKVGCLVPLEYKYLHHGLLNLGHKASSAIIVSNNDIIKSLNWGTSCPMIWIKPISKQQDKQINEQSQHHFYLPLGIAFYCKVYHRRFTIACK